MKKIIIAPYAQTLTNGKENPKNYPYWEKLNELLSKEYRLVQISIGGQKKLPYVHEIKYGLKMKQIEELVKDCYSWISVDSFLQHLVNASDYKKPGIVLWSQSDPRIFGYPYNLNILKDRKYLRPFQFGIWEEVEYNIEAYCPPEEAFEKIRSLLL